MRALPPSAVVVYEDAGFHVPELSRRVRDGLLDLVDVYSMNEDEMQAYVGRPLALLDAGEMAIALNELHSIVPARTLVVHTEFWSLALGDRAEAFRLALTAGASMAAARYRHGDDFTETEYLAVKHGPQQENGKAFARAIEVLRPGEVSCVPSFMVSSLTPTTIGLGDSFVGGFIAELAGAAKSTAELR